MLVEELIKKVRITMDENSSSSRLAEIKDIDSLQLDELIRESIVAGVKYIHSNADVTELTDDVTEDASTSSVEEKMSFNVFADLIIPSPQAIISSST